MKAPTVPRTPASTPGSSAATNPWFRSTGQRRSTATCVCRTTPRRATDAPEVVRSEEELRVKPGPMRPRERVRLKKYLVTDYVEKTVPVRREEVRIEHEPPPDDD